MTEARDEAAWPVKGVSEQWDCRVEHDRGYLCLGISSAVSHHEESSLLGSALEEARTGVLEQFERWKRALESKRGELELGTKTSHRFLEYLRVGVKRSVRRVRICIT